MCRYTAASLIGGFPTQRVSRKVYTTYLYTYYIPILEIIFIEI